MTLLSILQMQPFLDYFLYYAVHFLNYVDRICLIVFKRRLQSLNKKAFLESLPPPVLKEVEDPDISEPLDLHLEGLQKDKQLSFFVRLTTYFPTAHVVFPTAQVLC